MSGAPAWLAAAAALAVQADLPAPAGDAAGDGRIVATSGAVGAAGTDGGQWFAIDLGEQRFRLPPVSAEEADRYIDLINAATERGFSLHIRYDATAGQVGVDGPYVIYPLCSVTVGDATPIGDEAANCPPRPAPGESAEERLALGLGIAIERPEAAQALLGEALAAGTLPAQARALAFNVRGGVAERLAARHEPGSAEHDRLIAAALADYRGWLTLAPDETEARLAVARTLAGLGGYDEAVAVLEALGRAFPDRAFEVAIRLGAIDRLRGNSESALRRLDDFAARHGEPEGMRYHYHRAWTLMVLRRDSEAIAAIDKGLQAQPDYSWAYLLRSCVRARLGRLADALADQERAYALLMLLPIRDEPALAEPLARSRALTEELRAAIAAVSPFPGRTRPLPAACEGFWDRWLRTRPRSPLLDAPA